MVQRRKEYQNAHAAFLKDLEKRDNYDVDAIKKEWSSRTKEENLGKRLSSIVRHVEGLNEKGVAAVIRMVYEHIPYLTIPIISNLETFSAIKAMRTLKTLDAAMFYDIIEKQQLHSFYKVISDLGLHDDIPFLIKSLE